MPYFASISASLYLFNKASASALITLYNIQSGDSSKSFLVQNKTYKMYKTVIVPL